MNILALLKQLAFAAGRGAIDAIVKLVSSKPRTENTAQGLSHQNVEQQQAQIRSATSFKVKKP